MLFDLWTDDFTITRNDTGIVNKVIEPSTKQYKKRSSLIKKKPLLVIKIGNEQSFIKSIEYPIISILCTNTTSHRVAIGLLTVAFILTITT